jgi:hypothetical protein
MDAVSRLADVTGHAIRNLRAGLRPGHALRLALLNYEVSKLQQRRKK